MIDNKWPYDRLGITAKREDLHARLARERQEFDRLQRLRQEPWKRLQIEKLVREYNERLVWEGKNQHVECSDYHATTAQIEVVKMRRGYYWDADLKTDVVWDHEIEVGVFWISINHKVTRLSIGIAARDKTGKGSHVKLDLQDIPDAQALRDIVEKLVDEMLQAGKLKLRD